MFANMQLTLYGGYLPIFLTNNIVVSVLLFTIIISSINFFQIFLRIPMGSLSQSVGRKPSILLGNLLVNLALFSLFVANGFFIVFVSAILTALGMSLYWPACFSYIQDCDVMNYGKNNGRFSKLGDVGILIGSLFAKIYLDQFSLGLRSFFLILSVAGFLGTVFFVFTFPERLPEDQRIHTTIAMFINENFIKMVGKFKSITSYSGMSKIYFFQSILAFSDYFFVIFFPILIDSSGYSTGTLGEILFAGTFMLMWLKPFLGSLSDHYNYRKTLLLTLSAVSLLYILTPLLKGLLLFMILFFSVRTLLFIGYPAINKATASNAPSKQRGLALGSLGVYTSFGRFSSTLIISPIWDYFDIISCFLITGLLIFLFVIVLFFTTKIHLEKRNKTIIKSIN